MQNLMPKSFLCQFIKSALILIAALWGITMLALSLEEREDKPIVTITKAELRDHIYYLGSDFLEGRLPGSEGYAQAANYIASQLKAAGLGPLIKDKEGKETYFQKVDFMTCSIGPSSTLRVKKGQQETVFVFGEQFLPLLHAQAFKDGCFEGEPVFIGYGLEETGEGWNDYDNIDVSGKIAIVMGGTPMKDGKPVLSEEKDNFHKNFMQSASQRLLSAINHKASGLIFIPDQQTAKMWSKIAPARNRPQRRLKSYDQEGKNAFFPVFFLHPEAGAELLKETGFDPVSEKGSVIPMPLEGVRLTFDLDYEIEREYTCRNVVGFIPGSDAELKKEFVVVGAHLDHLGMRNGDAMNGADDNASGCAAILEAAEAAAMSPQGRSLFFVFFTGEEGGGHGSFHFVDNFPFHLKDIRLTINVDMVGRNSKPFPEAVLGVAPDNLKRELSEFIEDANTDIAHVHLKTYAHEKDLGGYYGGSDEVMFHMRGIPAILITTGYSHADYHKPSDEPDKINYDKVKEASRLIYALAIAAANAEKIY